MQQPIATAIGHGEADRVTDAASDQTNGKEVEGEGEEGIDVLRMELADLLAAVSSLYFVIIPSLARPKMHL